jgi:hypothetical protein
MPPIANIKEIEQINVLHTMNLLHEETIMEEITIEAPYNYSICTRLPPVSSREKRRCPALAFRQNGACAELVSTGLTSDTISSC